MPEIDNHNCAGLCSQKYCNKEETHFVNIDIHGIILILPLCEKHYNEYVDRILEAHRKQDELSQKLEEEYNGIITTPKQLPN